MVSYVLYYLYLVKGELNGDNLELHQLSATPPTCHGNKLARHKKSTTMSFPYQGICWNTFENWTLIHCCQLCVWQFTSSQRTPIRMYQGQLKQEKMNLQTTNNDQFMLHRIKVYARTVMCLLNKRGEQCCK
jgi:hypothetical protein